MKVIEQGTAQRLVVGPGLLVCAYAAAPTMSDVVVIRTAIATEPDLQGGYHLMVTVDSSAVTQAVQLDAHVRNALGDVMKSAPLRSAAYVLEVSGFTGVAIRAVFTGFMLLGRKRPERVFSSVPEAVAWTSSLPRADPHTIAWAMRAAAATETQADIRVSSSV
jgi:hypothetical protein